MLKVAIFILFYVIAILLYELPRVSGDSSAKVLFVDVGQGDASFIKTPSGKTILIDGGSNFEIDYALFKEMPLGRCKLDVVILTHPHKDHMEGLNRVLQRCEVGVVLTNLVDYQSRTYEVWKSLLIEDQVKYNLSAFSGHRIIVDQISFYILWPSEQYLNSREGTKANVNNISIVILMDYKEFEAVFLGDAQIEVLSKIDFESVSHMIDGDIEILKVSHHGSLNGLDKNLTDSLSPKFAVISVGEENKYGHPSTEVLEYFSSNKIATFRTDLHGDIQFILK